MFYFFITRPGSSTSLGSLGAGEAGPVSVSGSDSGVEIPMSPGSGDGETRGGDIGGQGITLCTLQSAASPIFPR